jgi:hypothetical protein
MIDAIDNWRTKLKNSCQMYLKPSADVYTNAGLLARLGERYTQPLFLAPNDPTGPVQAIGRNNEDEAVGNEQRRDCFYGRTCL